MQLKYTGVGTRTLNFVIDTTVISLLAIIAYKTNNWYVKYWKTTFYNFGWFYFGFQFLYYTIFELIKQKTLGKIFTQTIVIASNGSKPSLLQVIGRSAVRIFFLEFLAIPFINKPLHDYLTKTEVVEL